MIMIKLMISLLNLNYYYMNEKLALQNLIKLLACYILEHRDSGFHLEGKEKMPNENNIYILDELKYI